jgi:nucleotide-binding universal stress UspA family protein
MILPVVAGMDGSAESRQAAEWAAEEARRRGTRLRLLHVWQWELAATVQLPDAGAQRERAREMLEETRERLAQLHPGLEVTAQQLSGPVADTLVAAGDSGELLVVGSRGLGGFTGLLVGSVGLQVAGRTRHPVVLVRRSEAKEPFAGHGEVVVGVDGREPSDTVVRFAYDEAARRRAVLRAVLAWSVPGNDQSLMAVSGVRQEVEDQQAQHLAEILNPWADKYPSVLTVPHVVQSGAAKALVQASATADLVVVGRRMPKYPLPGPRLGPVAHAAIHHVHCPVAVVPHS